MEAAVDPKFRRIVVVCGSQMGKTELLLNLIGHRLDIDPAPVIFVAASQRQVEAISTGRVAKMIRTTPSLDAKLDKRGSANKVGEKTIGGQRLGFAWAGSAIELSSHPAALVLLDERDRMEDLPGEGDPVSLAEARTATYPDGKVVVTSTPTIQGGSPVWALYEGGTRHRWTWPCPECETYFAPSFDLLKWGEKSTPAQAKRSARLACPHCGSLIADTHRARMNAAGRFEVQGDPDSDCASFHVSGLCSPWRSWGDAAKQWVEAAHSHEQGRVQATKNTVFGELFQVSGEAPEAAKVQALRGVYQFDELPEGARLITCGVDVQKDRVVYAIRAWGSRATSWLLRHGEVWGETDQPAVWDDLANLMEQTWGQLRIRLMLVDSGYRPDPVHRFAARFPGRVIASKGHDTQAKPVYVSKLQVNTAGKTRKGASLAHVDAGYFKGFVHGRIVWPLDQPGAWHLPKDATDDYCTQLLAESRVVKQNGSVLWVRSARANHYLDCEALNAAAAHMLNVHAIRAAKAKTATTAEGEPKTEAVRPPPRRTGWVQPTRRSGWVSRW
jgi:phage terminase large subunit GpA-like protein